MGQSTDGILAYGIDLGEVVGEGEDEEEETEDDEEKRLLALYYPEIWAKRPTEPYGEATKAEYSTWWRLMREWTDRVPVVFVDYCSGSYPMKILAIRGAAHDVSRGRTKKLGQNIVSLPVWRVVLKDACQRLKIEFQEPEWLLASYWGD